MNDQADTIVGLAAANQTVSTVENIGEIDETTQTEEVLNNNSTLMLSAKINFEQYLG